MAKKGPLGVRGVRCTFFEMRFFEMRFFLLDSRRAGRVFKRFLEAVGFILAEFELKRSHGDPIRDNFYGFWTRELAQLCLRERNLCLRERHISV